MDTSNNIKGHSLATYLVASVGLFLIGATIGFFFYPYLSVSSSTADSAQKEYQAGFAAARALVENSSLGAMIKTPADIRTLSGTVTANNGNSLTLHVQSVNPFDDPALADRSILITASTTVMQRIQKDPTVFKTEVANFLKNPQGATTTRVLPENYIFISAKASDIKVGDTVSVIALSNIKLVREFDASAIQILPKTSSL